MSFEYIVNFQIMLFKIFQISSNDVPTSDVREGAIRFQKRPKHFLTDSE